MTLAMLPNLVLLQLETPRPLNLALESFVAGLLVALALLVVSMTQPCDIERF